MCQWSAFVQVRRPTCERATSALTGLSPSKSSKMIAAIESDDVANYRLVSASSAPASSANGYSNC